jgi:hypothetical protein
LWGEPVKFAPSLRESHVPDNPASGMALEIDDEIKVFGAHPNPHD